MSELKIQFGCGGNILQGWRNHDIETNITVLPLPYESDSVDMVLAEHVVEHTSSPDCLRFFEDVRRILKPGGVFRVCVPAIAPDLKREHTRDLIVNHGHLIMFNRNILEVALWAAGFDKIVETERKPIDGHWREIGEELDRIETIRYEATK